MRIAYVVGIYPSVSHTFVLREVRALRRLGAEIEPISIHRPTPTDLLAAADCCRCSTSPRRPSVSRTAGGRVDASWTFSGA
jgi:hypothetical protein